MEKVGDDSLEESKDDLALCDISMIGYGKKQSKKIDEQFDKLAWADCSILNETAMDYIGMIDENLPQPGPQMQFRAIIAGDLCSDDNDEPSRTEDENLEEFNHDIEDV